MSKTSFDKSKIRILLLEGVHQNAIKTFNAAGYTNIESISSALSEDELKAKIADAHFVGIRSRTQLTKDVFDVAEKLVAVGCFCIGTNQVDLNAARERGIVVFNAPYSNIIRSGSSYWVRYHAVAWCSRKAWLLMLANGSKLQQARTRRVVKPWALLVMAALVPNCLSCGIRHARYLL